jgi:protein translocase SecG subunit
MKGFFLFLVAFFPSLWHTYRAMLRSLLPSAQILVSILLIAVILMQPSTAGVGGAMGGSDGMQAFRTKRGFEKFLFVATIVLGIIFTALGVIAIVL